MTWKDLGDRWQGNLGTSRTTNENHITGDRLTEPALNATDGRLRLLNAHQSVLNSRTLQSELLRSNYSLCTAAAAASVNESIVCTSAMCEGDA